MTNLKKNQVNNEKRRIKIVIAPNLNQILEIMKFLQKINSQKNQIEVGKKKKLLIMIFNKQKILII